MEKVTRSADPLSIHFFFSCIHKWSAYPFPLLVNCGRILPLRFNEAPKAMALFIDKPFQGARHCSIWGHSSRDPAAFLGRQGKVPGVYRCPLGAHPSPAELVLNVLLEALLLVASPGCGGGVIITIFGLLRDEKTPWKTLWGRLNGRDSKAEAANPFNKCTVIGMKSYSPESTADRE